MSEDSGAVEKALKEILTINSVLMSPLGRGFVRALVSCSVLSGLLIGFVTEYYTSNTYVSVKEVAETQQPHQKLKPWIPSWLPRRLSTRWQSEVVDALTVLRTLRGEWKVLAV